MSKRIFITGDSWGCGEWHPHKRVILHKGIEQFFLEENFIVFNSSKPNGSNAESIQSLKQNLDRYSSPGDTVLFVQTDPLRNCDPFIHLPGNFRFYNLASYIKIHQSLKNIMHFCLDIDYQQLNQLGNQFDIDINLVGGHSSINTELAQKYPRLKVLVKSWCEILVGSKYPDIDYNNFNLWGNLALEKTLISDMLRNDQSLPLPTAVTRTVVEELHTFHVNKQIFADPLFHPDGDHPNRNGHEILFNFIREKI